MRDRRRPGNHSDLAPNVQIHLVGPGFVALTAQQGVVLSDMGPANADVVQIPVRLDATGGAPVVIAAIGQTHKLTLAISAYVARLKQCSSFLSVTGFCFLAHGPGFEQPAYCGRESEHV